MNARRIVSEHLSCVVSTVNIFSHVFSSIDEEPPAMIPRNKTGGPFKLAQTTDTCSGKSMTEAS